LGSIAAPGLPHTTAIREVLTIVQLLQAGGAGVVLVTVHCAESHNSVKEAPVVSISVCSVTPDDDRQQARRAATRGAVLYRAVGETIVAS
jgi:hypothetical protein